MMAGKVVGLGFEIISRLDRYFLMTVTKIDFNFTVFFSPEASFVDSGNSDKSLSWTP